MVQNVSMTSFHVHKDNYGSLVAVETQDNIPFDVKRVYYIYDVENGQRRGFHSHRGLHQALICVHGSVTILVKTPHGEENIRLDKPNEALLIGPMVWREMYDFSPDAVLMVLASEHYTPSDYIRDYEEYEKEAIAFFSSEQQAYITET